MRPGSANGVLHELAHCMRREHISCPGFVETRKFRFAGHQVLSACTILLLAVNSDVQAAVDINCNRYDQFSWQQVQEGDDPWARRCRLFVDGGMPAAPLPQVDDDEQEIARIYSDFQFGNYLGAFNRAEKWLVRHSTSGNRFIYGATNLLMRAAYFLSRDEAAVKAAEKQLQMARASPSAKQAEIRAREFELALLLRPKLRTEPSRTMVESRTTTRGNTLIQISIEGKLVNALIDTGAEFSVINSDLAAALGFEIVDDIQVPFQQIFEEPYYSSFAAAPTLRIGEMQVENAYFLVTDPIRDDSPGSHVILGLQLVEQFGRMGLLDRGERVAFGDAAPEPECLGDAGQIFRHNDGIGLSVTMDGELAPAHYDTGFLESSVYEAPLSFYAPGRRIRKFSQGPGKIGRSPLVIGAFREFDFEMAGAPVRDRKVLAFRSRDPDRRLDFPLTVGGSTTRRLDAIVLDFKTMRYAAVKDPSPRTDACFAEASARLRQD